MSRQCFQSSHHQRVDSTKGGGDGGELEVIRRGVGVDMTEVMKRERRESSSRRAVRPAIVARAVTNLIPSSINIFHFDNDILSFHVLQNDINSFILCPSYYSNTGINTAHPVDPTQHPLSLSRPATSTLSTPSQPGKHPALNPQTPACMTPPTPCNPLQTYSYSYILLMKSLTRPSPFAVVLRKALRSCSFLSFFFMDRLDSFVDRYLPPDVPTPSPR